MKTDDQIREEAHERFPPILEKDPKYDVHNCALHFIDLNGDAREAYIDFFKSAQSSMEAEIQKLKNHIDWQESRLEKERKDNDEVRSTQSKMIDKLLSKCDTLEIEIDRRANEKAKQMIEEMFEMLYSQRNKCKQFLNPSEGENQ
jgi:ribosomal protein L15